MACRRVSWTKDVGGCCSDRAVASTFVVGVVVVMLLAVP